MTTPKHWAADLIGAPWAQNGNGPDAFDCLGLVREAARRLGLPPVPDIAEAADSEWRVVADCQVDDIVTMQGPDGSHVGIMIRANGRLGVLHSNGHQTATGPVGLVEFQDLSIAKANGYGRVKFWRASCRN